MSASIEAYRTTNLSTANPRQVLLKTFDAGVRFLGQAEEALAAGADPADGLTKARTIVGGLMVALNFEAGEMAQQLLRCYLFVLDRIQTTSVEGADAGLGEARRVLETLKSAWDEMPPGEARLPEGARRPAGLSLKG
jgi:flagellin-specific chaperone FliS